MTFQLPGLASSHSPIYLDHNATTPLDPRVAERMQPFLADAFGNPASRDHAFGWDAAEAVEEARSQVAELVGARPSEIIFTSGATESISFALKGLAARFTAVVTSATEHEAVLEVCRQLQRTQSVAATYLGVDRCGQADIQQLRHVLGESPPSLAAFAVANAETGTILPVGELARVARECGALFFSDLAQAVGRIPVDVHELGIDLAAFSAHKMHGPKGVGALFIRGGEPMIELEPLIVGGGQERGMRGGTLNVPGIVGFGEACRIARLEWANEAERVGRLRDRLESELLAKLPGIQINGDRDCRLPNTSNMTCAGVDARSLIRDMHDIAVSTRSACSSGQSGPSHVLKAMGLSDEQAYASIRFSLGRFTTDDEVEYACGRLIASVIKLRNV